MEQCIDKAAELGFDGVMLMAKRPHLSVLDYGPAERADLRRRIERCGLRHVLVAGYNNLTADLEHLEIPHREIQVHYIVELARLAADLGGNLVRVFTGYEHPAAAHQAQWDLVISALKEAAQRAASYSVTIGVQNHHDIGVDFEEHYDLIQAVGEPNCRALFDAWAPALQGTGVIVAARKMAPLTVHTTVANYQRRRRFRYEADVVNYAAETARAQAVPIDEGIIDYTVFLEALREGGFRGTVAYEMCSPLLGGGDVANLDRYARRFLEFMERVPAAEREPQLAEAPRG